MFRSGLGRHLFSGFSASVCRAFAHPRPPTMHARASSCMHASAAHAPHPRARARVTHTGCIGRWMIRSPCNICLWYTVQRFFLGLVWLPFFLFFFSIPSPSLYKSATRGLSAAYCFFPVGARCCFHVYNNNRLINVSCNINRVTVNLLSVWSCQTRGIEQIKNAFIFTRVFPCAWWAD